MIYITLPKHPMIIAHKYFCEYSFPGLIEGKPTREMINERLSEVEKVCNGKISIFDRIWKGEAKTKIYYYKKEYDFDDFPTYFCVAEFQSTNATNKTHMMSYMTVAWFMDFVDGLDYNKSIQLALQGLDWDQNAANGDY